MLLVIGNEVICHSTFVEFSKLRSPKVRLGLSKYAPCSSFYISPDYSPPGADIKL
jgi:hypothetical protein